MPIYGSGRVGSLKKSLNLIHYELTDHLGNVRATVSNFGGLRVENYADYYPFGEINRSGGTLKYGYQGQYSEKDGETGWNAFELRMYDPVIGRWMGPDPMRQYYSSYIRMGNNPVSGVDPTGGECETCPKRNTNGFQEEYHEGIGWTVPEVDVYGFTQKTSFIDHVKAVDAWFEGDGGRAIGTFVADFNPLWSFSNFVTTTFSSKDLYGNRVSHFDRGMYALGSMPFLGIVDDAAKAVKGVASGAHYSVAFEMKLAKTSYPGVYRGAHFKEANQALEAAMASDAGFATMMSELGVIIPRSSAGSIVGKSPVNWVWHHSVEPGVMQLVPKNQHTVGSIF